MILGGTQVLSQGRSRPPSAGKGVRPLPCSQKGRHPPPESRGRWAAQMKAVPLFWGKHARHRGLDNHLFDPKCLQLGQLHPERAGVLSASTKARTPEHSETPFHTPQNKGLERQGWPSPGCLISLHRRLWQHASQASWRHFSKNKKL